MYDPIIRNSLVIYDCRWCTARDLQEDFYDYEVYPNNVTYMLKEDDKGQKGASTFANIDVPLASNDHFSDIDYYFQ